MRLALSLGVAFLVGLNLVYLATVGWYGGWWDFYYTQAEKELARGRTEQAEKGYEKALHYAELMVPSDGRMARTYHDMGMVAWMRGRPDLARLYFDRSERLFAHFDGPESYFVGVVNARQGEMALQQGDLARAEAKLRRSNALLVRNVGSRDNLAMRTQASLGLALLYLGRRAEARRQLAPVAAEIRGNDKLGDLVYWNQVTSALKTLHEVP